MTAPTAPLAALSGPAGRATGAVYAALFMGMGVHLPFWPLWLKEWGLSEAEIGLFLGAGIAARIAGGLGAPFLADWTGRRRTALALAGAVAMLAFLAHGGVESRGALLALTVLAAVALGGTVPVADALASATGRAAGFVYAHARAIGSAAFLLTNLAAGAAIGFWGAGAALWLMVAAMAGLALAALLHPGAPAEDGPRPKLADALRLARARPVLLAAAASATLQAAHAPLYAYGSVTWRAQGIDEATIGALWAFGVAAETALMLAVGGALVAKLGALGCFALSGAASIARFAVLATAPEGATLWAAQLAHALTFAPAHLGMIAFVAAAAPPALSASAQGLIGAAAGGAAMAAGSLASAALYPFAGAATHLLGAALGAAGLAATVALGRTWRGERLAVDRPAEREGEPA